MHSQRGLEHFETAPPSPIYRKKGRCLPPKDLMKKISKRTRITKFTPPFRILRKSYGSLTELFSNLIFIFFLFPFTNVKWNMLTQGFRKFYGSITEAAEAPKTIFQKRGGACRPVASSLSNPTSKMFWKGLDLNCYLHPYLDKFTPLPFLVILFS